MTINGTSGVSASAGMQAGQTGMARATDPVGKDIQNQISNLQKQLQELSANTELSTEAKMKKRQEIQKQISDLNVQLRQHQIEMRKQEQEKKSSFDDMLGGEPQAQGAKTKSKGQGMPSQASMEAMISAGVAMDQAKVNASVATKMEGRAGVLKAEIALDSSRGGDTSAKEAEFADAEQKAMEATSSQMSMLSKANETMEEASEKDTTEETKEKKAGEEGEEVKTGDAAGSASETQGESAAEELEAVILPVRQYTPVDVRL